jgi:3-dehydroquinate synthase
MGHDKKVVSGRKRLILARGIGEAFITDDVDDASISDVIDNARAQ